jgi:transposase
LSPEGGVRFARRVFGLDPELDFATATAGCGIGHNAGLVLEVGGKLGRSLEFPAWKGSLNFVKPRIFAALPLAQWMRELLLNSQPILLALQEKIALCTVQLQSAAAPSQPRGLGKMTSVIIDREIGDWRRFNNRRQIASYTGLCPGEYSSGNTRLQSCVTKHGNPRLRAALVELAWRLVRF